MAKECLLSVRLPRAPRRAGAASTKGAFPLSPLNYCLPETFWLAPVQAAADVALFGAFGVMAASAWLFMHPREAGASPGARRERGPVRLCLASLLVFLTLCAVFFLLHAVTMFFPLYEMESVVKGVAAGAAVAAAGGAFYGHQSLERRDQEQRATEEKARERARQLAASKARFETLVLASAEVFWTADASGQVVEASPTWSVFTGQSPEEQMGEGWMDAVHPDDRERVRSLWRASVKIGGMFEAEYRLRHVAGDWRWMASRAVPPITELGTVREWVGMNEDITERKRAEEEIRLQADQYATILAATSDGYWLVDWEGSLRDVNDAYCRMSGYTREELLSMKVGELDVQAAAEAGKYIGEIQRSGFVHFESRHRRKDGDAIFAEVNAVYWKPTNQVVLFIRDISERKRSELALRESEEKLTEAQQIGDLGSWEFDIASGKLTWSEEMYRLSGRDRNLPLPSFEETLAHVHPDDRERVLHAFEKLMETGTPSQHEYRIVRSDGEERIMDARARRYDDANGVAVRVAGVVHDITERKRIEEQLAEAAMYIRSLFEASLDLFVTVSTDGKILDINRAGERIGGAPRERAIGTDLASYVTEPDKIRRALKEALEKGAVRDVEVTVRSTSGEPVQLLCNTSVFRNRDGAPGGVFAAGRDITQLKQIQNELRRHREHLEELVEQRTRELEKTNAKLQDANREMEAFSYSVSHDLRVPLRAVDGFSRILIEDYGDKFDADGMRIINIIRENTVRMGVLIDDILSFSRVSRAELVMSDIDTDAMVQSVMRALEPGLQDRKVTFNVGALPPVSGDSSTLQRVWSNLIENAVKYSSKTPEALIEIGAIPGKDETTFYVKDNGAGFDMAHVDRLFGVFQRLHGPEFGGTGIGLAIVKRIVNRHGGRIWAEGKVGEGAAFYFTLPVEAAPSATGEAEAA